MEEQIPRIQLVGSIVPIKGGSHSYNGLMIRKIFVKKEIVKAIVFDILKKGAFDFYGQVVFMDRKKAVLKLKEAKLI